MKVSAYLAHFLRSPLGIGLLFLSVLGSGAALAAGLGLLAALGILAGLALLLFLLALASGLGPRAAWREKEGLDAERGRASLARCAEQLKRLEVLRIADPEIRAARDAAALAGGLYLAAASCPGAAGRVPAAEAAVADCLDLVQAWLREADESATERRFGVADAHPFPEARARVAAALRDKAALMGRARDEAEGSPPPQDRLAIEEELR